MLRGLTRPGYGWRNHPAVKMWAGYEEALDPLRAGHVRGLDRAGPGRHLRHHADRRPRRRVRGRRGAYPGRAGPTPATCRRGSAATTCTSATARRCCARTRRTTARCSAPTSRRTWSTSGPPPTARAAACRRGDWPGEGGARGAVASGGSAHRRTPAQVDPGGGGADRVPRPVSAVVVGGGIAGMSAAVVLAERGCGGDGAGGGADAGRAARRLAGGARRRQPAERARLPRVLPAVLQLAVHPPSGRPRRWASSSRSRVIRS